MKKVWVGFGRISKRKGFGYGLLGFTALIALVSLLHAQTAINGGLNGGVISGQSPASDTIVNTVADEMGLTLMSPDQIPRGGTFWWVMPGGSAVPTPCPPPDANIAIYQVADGQFIADTTGGQVMVRNSGRLGLRSGTTFASAVQAQASGLIDLINQIQDNAAVQQLRMVARALGMDIPGFGDGGGGDGSGSTNSYPSFTIDTNLLWLEITNVSNGWSYLSLHSGTNQFTTNQVFAILTKTNLLDASWVIEQEVWPTDPNCQPFALPNYDRQILFIKAMDWTGVDSDGDGIPDWWAWKYFGTINISDTNLDYSGNGNTFAQDYSSNITPTVFQFTGIEVMNHYVSSSQPVVQLDVTGSPYYIAMLVDSTNINDAVWNTYNGSCLTVNLGSMQGWHEVWIGLSAHSDDPTNAVWQEAWFYLELTSPTLILTGPTTNLVVTPFIQLTGYSTVPLTSISYDLSNSTGTSTNQAGYLNNQSYDRVHQVLATNYFQCYDVPLTNGMNIITLHATDVAGNTTALTTNIALDYSIDHTAPTLNVIWPTNGTAIAGINFMVEAQVDDPTATIMTTVMDANGNTKAAVGTVDRDGTAWVKDLPMAAGTSVVTVTATDAAGNSNSTSLMVYQSSVLLTINPLDINQLGNISGTVSDRTAPIKVNGIVAGVDAAGEWNASGVPVNPGLMAVYNLEVYPGTGIWIEPTVVTRGGNGGSSLINRLNAQPNDETTDPGPAGLQMAAQWEPPVVQVVDFHLTQLGWSEQWFDPYYRWYQYDSYKTTVDWLEGVGGIWHDTDSRATWFDGNITDSTNSDTPTALPGGFANANAIYGMPMEHFSPRPPATPLLYGIEWISLFGMDAHTALKTRGKLVPGQTNIYLVKVQVRDMDNNIVPVDQVRVLGFTLTPDGADTNWGDYLVSAPGQATVAMTPQTDAVKNYTFSFQVAQVSLQLALDANRDGSITFDSQNQSGPDHTTAEQPYCFWLNNNHDGNNSSYNGSLGNIFMGSVTVQDDLGGNADASSSTITCTRDLEDYTRLGIQLNGIDRKFLTNGTVTVKLESDGPQIRIFSAVAGDSTAYLQDANTAQQQISAPYNSALGTVGSYEFPAKFWADNYPTANLLFDGISAGSGTLKLSIYKNGKQIGESQPVYVNLQDVHWMYENSAMGKEANQYILFVHGWNMDDTQKDQFANTAYKRLWWQGYRGRFGMFSWPTLTGAFSFDQSEQVAWQSAQGLANTIGDLDGQYGKDNVYLFAHSMGNIVASEALKKLNGTSYGVNTYVACQAAIANHAFDPNNTNVWTTSTNTPDDFGYYPPTGANYFAGVGGNRYNFRNVNDYALDWWESDQSHKPNALVFPGHHYSSSDGYYRIAGSTVTYLHYPADTYEIFAMCVQNPSRALGVTAGVSGFVDVDLWNVWGGEDADVYGHNFRDHPWHSAEFLFSTVEQWNWWETLLSSPNGFNLK